MKHPVAVGICILVILLDVLWRGYWNFGAMLLNVSLCSVIAITMIAGIRTGLVIGIFAGVAYAFFSALSPARFLLAFPMASLGTMFFSRRIVTSRSRLSFLTTVLTGTVVFSLTLLIVQSTTSWFNRQSLQQPYVMLLTSLGLQSLIHPPLLSWVWRLTGRERYDRLAAPLQREL